MLQSLGFETVITSSRPDQNRYQKTIRVDFLNKETWNQDALKLPFDFVLHAAAASPSSLNPNFLETNFHAPLDFFYHIKFTEECKFIFCSTSGVYGRTYSKKFSEKSTPAPENEYAKSKLLFEDNIPEVIKSSGSKGHLLILRIPTLLGRRVSKNIIHRWIETSIAKKEIVVFNAHNAFSSIILEQDIVERIRLEFQGNAFGRSVLNCYSNGDLTYLQVANLISNKFGGKLPKVDESGAEHALTMTNTEERWFDKISTETSLIFHLSQI
jgi:nucleoside-diphosphate-sugar epimerase